MGATKLTTSTLEIVKSYKATIQESQFGSIAKHIVDTLKDHYLHYGCVSFRVNCANGIRIDYEARYDDEDGDSIALESIEISDNIGSVFSTEEEAIGDLIDDLLEKYNHDKEFEFDAQRMSKKELFAEYNL